MYTGSTPESVIASAIAKKAQPLIENGQYLQDQLTNATSEMNRILDDNKEIFKLQQDQRTNNRNLAFQLYGTINAEEIRQEDIAREDDRLRKEILLEQYRYGRNRTDQLADLEKQQDYNLQTGLLQLGVDPTGLTVDEMRQEYANAAKMAAQAKASEVKTGLKPGEFYLENGVLKKVPSNSGSRTNPTGNVVSVNVGNKDIQLDSA